MFFLRHIPNALTCSNLLCGCLGIVAISEGSDISPAYFVWAACVFDFLDGFLARALKVTSPIGKELDSLADMTSFGILPAMAMHQMMVATTESKVIPGVALLLAVFSALRLAKFNIDQRQQDGFIGLPTPANALFITALAFLPERFEGFHPDVYTLTGITLLFCFLLVSPLELFALKFKTFGWRENQLRFTFLAISVLLIALLGKAAVGVTILIYILLSLLNRRRDSTISPKIN